MHNYLFGAPATPRKPMATGHCEWFILGAYPSALHVKWTPPEGRGLAAVAVADEPEPFWEGDDEAAHISNWSDALPWKPDWGKASSPGERNGFSGARLQELVLKPLSIDRRAAWITDCLDLYHESDKAAARFAEPEMAALLTKLNIKDRVLPSHPDDRQIVATAQRDRLLGELAECQPNRVITLGNAALSVFGMLIEGAPPIGHLAPDASYGQTHEVRLSAGPPSQLLPLAHPAAPDRYQQAHARWLESRQRDA